MAWYDNLTSENVMAPAAAGFAGLGAFSSLMGAMRAMEQAKQQDEMSFRLRQLARQGVDPSRFYQPMSAAENTARTRAIKADLASRGIPADAGYTTNLVAEGMAGTETQRYQSALDAALRHYAAQTGALQAGMPGQPQFPSGNVGPMFAYLAALAKRRQQQPGAGPSQVTNPEAWGAYRAGERDPYGFNQFGTGEIPDGQLPALSFRDENRSIAPPVEWGYTGIR